MTNTTLSTLLTNITIVALVASVDRLARLGRLCTTEAFRWNNLTRVGAEQSVDFWTAVAAGVDADAVRPRNGGTPLTLPRMQGSIKAACQSALLRAGAAGCYRDEDGRFCYE